jgi:PKD repeat protein
MFTRRELLKSSAVGTAIGAGVLASSSSAAASGASFGDGVNLQPAYYCSGDQDLGWPLMNDNPKIQTTRIELEPPSWGETSATLADEKRWIDEAAANGKTVIATCHHYPNNGSGNKQDLLDAANWWADNYSYFAQDSDFIINLMNEWGSHDTTRTQYADAYNDAISIIRNNTSYTGPIICDLSGYGQEYHICADAATNITDDNIILSAHIYNSAYNSDKGRYVIASDLDYLNDNQPYPCMVGEFGSKMSGQADWSKLVDRAKSLGWPVLGWAWNGDGGQMNMVSPDWGSGCSGPYSKSKYFSTVYDKLGSSNTYPTASFTYSPSSPSTGESVSFDGSGSSDPDGSISSYDWDFGDGTTATGSTASHSYSSSGDYAVTLTVTDDAGATDSTTQTVSVGSSSGGNTTQNLEAENGSLNGTTTSTSRSGYSGSGYVTEFNNSGDSVTVSFDATEAATRTVKIRYASEYDDKNCSLDINGSQVATPTLPQTTSFTTTTVGDFAFDAGTNTVTIRKNWGYYDIDQIIVEGSGDANSAPTAFFTYSPSSPSTGESVSFDGSDSTDSDGSISSYDWDFGDGTTATGQTTSHSYDSGGDYTVTLTVTDDAGATATSSQTVSVGNSGTTAPAIDSYSVTEAGNNNPHAEITADWAVSDADGDLASVDVTVYDSGGAQADSATTTVSGSSASGTDTFTIKKASGQTFDVELVVTDSAGQTASQTQTVTE